MWLQKEIYVPTTWAIHVHTHGGVSPGIELLCGAQGGAVSDTNYREQRGREPHFLSSVSFTHSFTSIRHTFTQTLNTHITIVTMILPWISGSASVLFAASIFFPFPLTLIASYFFWLLFSFFRIGVGLFLFLISFLPRSSLSFFCHWNHVRSSWWVFMHVCVCVLRLWLLEVV